MNPVTSLVPSCLQNNTTGRVVHQHHHRSDVVSILSHTSPETGEASNPNGALGRVFGPGGLLALRTERSDATYERERGVTGIAT